MTAYTDARDAFVTNIVTGPAGSITPAKLRSLILAVVEALDDQDAALASDLSGKSDTGHSHAIADVTSLQTTLDGLLPKAGGVMTGPLQLSGAPDEPLEAATKDYVDQLIDAVELAANPVGASIMWNGTTPPAGYLEENGAAVLRASYASLFAALVKSATITVTIATPGVVTWTGHGLVANDAVKFKTSGALPTGITAGTTYYVRSTGLTANTFQISATAGGSAINTTGSQSGTHTGINAPHGDGDGSTTFNLPDMRSEFPRGWDNGRGIDSNRSFGSAQLDELKAHTHGVAGGVNAASGAAWNVPGNGAGSQSGSTGGTETRPRNKAKMFCIKY